MGFEFHGFLFYFKYFILKGFFLLSVTSLLRTTVVRVSEPKAGTLRQKALTGFERVLLQGGSWETGAGAETRI